MGAPGTLRRSETSPKFRARTSAACHVELYSQVFATSITPFSSRRTMMECLRPALSRSVISSRRAAPRQVYAPLYQCLHTGTPRHATPLPHPTTPGPPPEPPTPAVSQPEDRVARKRKQAELLQRGQALRANPAKPASVLQKRFWKDVFVNDTPGRTRLEERTSIDTHTDARWTPDFSR